MKMKNSCLLLFLVLLFCNGVLRAQSTIAEQTAYLDSVLTDLSDGKNIDLKPFKKYVNDCKNFIIYEKDRIYNKYP